MVEMQLQLRHNYVSMFSKLAHFPIETFTTLESYHHSDVDKVRQSPDLEDLNL